MSDAWHGLSDRDRVASSTAIAKAAWRGALREIAHYSHAIDASTASVKVNTWFHGLDGEISEPDVWAEEYGAEE